MQSLKQRWNGPFYAVGLILLSSGCQNNIFWGGGEQGSANLSLNSVTSSLCNKVDNDWTLRKKVVEIEGNVTTGRNVTWKVDAVRGEQTKKSLLVNGVLSVENRGSSPTSIGNIVVNLQRKKNVGSTQEWISSSVDIADFEHGDAAILAKIASSSSKEQETLNGLFNIPVTYHVQGERAEFTENQASGTLSFMDQKKNTLWSIHPASTIQPGEVINLLFTASFNNTVLQIPPGEQIRIESIVSFGNASNQEGYGTAAAQVDINGNGVIDAEEGYVRTISAVSELIVPIEQQGNQNVRLTESGITTSQGIQMASYDAQGYEKGMDISESTSFYLRVNGVEDDGKGGMLCAKEVLQGDDCNLPGLVGYRGVEDPDNRKLEPVYYDFPCVTAVSINSSDCVTFERDPNQFQAGNYCTYGQGAYANRGASYQILEQKFPALYPKGLEIGIVGDSGFSMKFSSAKSIQNYLPATATPEKLTMDLSDPLSSSAGVFGGQVLSFRINLDLSAAGVTPKGLGNLYYCKVGDALHGKKLTQIYDVMQTALGGGALPIGYTYSALNGLADSLNTSAFQGCGLGDFVGSLSKIPCDQ